MTNTSPTSPSRSTSRLLSLGAGAVLVVLLAGCGAGGDAESTTSKAAGQVAPASEDASGGASDEVTSSDQVGAPGERTSARVLPIGRDIVYRGQVTVRVGDVARAAARAESLAVGVDGVVFSEETTVDPRQGGGPGQATLSLRVPPTQFASTLDALGALGTELSRTRSAQDVTAELADTGSRVRSQERSVARVRALLSEADTIGEVVQVESELARREADLESLQAQLARLADVTDLASIDVTLIARGMPGPTAGLRGGWHALLEVLVVSLTGLGALLPFAVLALVLGVPAYVLLRSRRRARPAPAAEPTV